MIICSLKVSGLLEGVPASSTLPPTPFTLVTRLNKCYWLPHTRKLSCGVWILHLGVDLSSYPFNRSSLQSEKEKQISYINAYMWNLEKWYRWSYLQIRNRDIERANMWISRGGEGGGGMNWRTWIYIYTLLYIKQITIENLLCSTENSTQCSVVT